MELDKNGILEYQKNRDPYLFIDKATKIVPGKSADGEKYLHEDEWFFKVHWPEDPNMPGMLQVEALVQLSALSVLTLPNNKGKIVYSDDETYSSSNIINKSGILLNDEQKIFLDGIKKKFSYEYISNIFNKFQKLKPLVIGETIIDQYIFCEVLGKSGKEPHLVIKDDFKETYLGGAGAIANHLSTFCLKLALVRF